MKATLTIEGTPEYINALMQGPEMVKGLLAEVGRLKKEREEFEAIVRCFMDQCKSGMNLYWSSYGGWHACGVSNNDPINLMHYVVNAVKEDAGQCAKDK